MNCNKDSPEKTMNTLKFKKLGKESNRLFFRQRARSRSFFAKENLLEIKAITLENDNKENFFGMGAQGTKIEYSPKDPEIINDYEMLELLFEEPLSPSVVSIV
jgi:hypothetical protein